MNLSPEEIEYLDQLRLALDGEYNTLPTRIPARVRRFLSAALVRDNLQQQMQVEIERLGRV